MGSLRDELFKAKLVSDKDVSKARRDEHQEKKELGRKTVEEQKRKEQEAREAEARARREEDKRREQSRRAEESKKESRFKVRDLARGAALPSARTGGTRRFYFVARSNLVPYLEVSQETGLDLEHGRLAIVEVEGKRRDRVDFVIVPRDAAERIQALDAEAVRFLNR